MQQQRPQYQHSLGENNLTVMMMMITQSGKQVPYMTSMLRTAPTILLGKARLRQGGQ
jgi:hypothetical protein